LKSPKISIMDKEEMYKMKRRMERKEGGGGS
jgi:hypothetical protein